MNSRSIIIGLCMACCAVTVAGVLVQGRRLNELRAEECQLQLEAQGLSPNATRPQPQPGDTNAAATTSTLSPSPELLRLRNQVSMLRRRQRELAAVPAENERLRAGSTASRTNAPAAPPGFIRTSEARSVGYSSPEATLQTMLWSLQNRDFASLRASLTPEQALELDRGLEQSGKVTEKFFEGAADLAGMNIIGRNSATNDLIELQVEVEPGKVSQTLLFRLINGEWKMDSH